MYGSKFFAVNASVRMLTDGATRRLRVTGCKGAVFGFSVLASLLPTSCIFQYGSHRNEKESMIIG